MSDQINHPSHYLKGGIEVIDVIEGLSLGFRLGNVIKYILRAELKGAPLTDLEKARWYLDREIQALRKVLGKSNVSSSLSGSGQSGVDPEHVGVPETLKNKR